MILQKRAAQKMTFPSVWTNACCSHPLWNEHEMCTDKNNVGIRRAARRKLYHELGIQSVDIDQMKVGISKISFFFSMNFSGFPVWYCHIGG